MRYVIAAVILAAQTQGALAGPFSKFEKKQPVADYVSARSIGEIERCLIDMDGQPAPMVYRQPDRPDEVNLLWVVGVSADARVELKKSAEGTHVRSWMSAKQARLCAP